MSHPSASASVEQPVVHDSVSSFRRRWTWRTQVWVVLAGWVIALVLRVLYLTLRVRYVDEAGVLGRRARGERFVATFWHDAIPLMPLMVTRLGWVGKLSVLLSWHRDAEIAAQTMRHFGIAAVRGSTNRGRLGGLRGLLEANARGDDPVIVPDGPRGPRHQAKPGVVQIARATGLPVVAFGAAALPVRRLGSWDRMQVPWPFARVLLVASEPIAVPRRGDPDAAHAAIEAALARVSAAADERVGAPAR